MPVSPPKTVRGKILFAYLIQLIIFAAAGIFVVSHLVELRSTSEDYFSLYTKGEELVIDSQFKIDAIRDTVLEPGSELDAEAFLLQAEQDLEQISLMLTRTVAPEGHPGRLQLLLADFSRSMKAPLRLYRQPVLIMEQADRYAEQLLLQAEMIHSAALVNAVAGIVDAYTDNLLTHGSGGERQKFDELVLTVERHPQVMALSSFPKMKQLALELFAVTSELVTARAEFRRQSQRLSEAMIELDKQFHAQILLPSQSRFVSSVEWIAWMAFLVFAFSAFLATVTSLLLTKRIWRPLADVGDMVRRMSEGELNHRMAEGGTDEVAEISRSMNIFADQLKDTLERLDEQMAEMTIVETNLRRSEEYNRTLSSEYQVVLDGISESLVVINEERNIVWSNKQASELIFSEIDQSVSSSEQQLKPDSSYFLGFEEVDICFATGEKVEEVVRSENGRYYRVKVFPLYGENGDVVRVLRILNDITEQYNLREEAERTSRLASLGELSAGVAHEINNPNSLVIVNSPILRDAFEDIMPILEEYYQQHGDFKLGGLSYVRMKYDLPLMLKEMHEGGMRIQRIVEDLKNFVSSGKQVDVEKVDLNQAVEAAVRLTKSAINKATSNFRLDLTPALPLVKGSLVQFEQVVVNLIQNSALALTDRMQSIEVSTRYDQPRREVVVEVVDAGKGIAAGDLDRILEPFFTTRRQQGGTGLGLSVSNRIVKSFQGKIDFHSTPGSGTRATVSFPVLDIGE